MYTLTNMEPKTLFAMASDCIISICYKNDDRTIIDQLPLPNCIKKHLSDRLSICCICNMRKCYQTDSLWDEGFCVCINSRHCSCHFWDQPRWLWVW